ncbi:hypothetical protein CEK28_02505 [Xenophilus sp. AP218F]|nr:hypothetical protein CEK28_02505 [Xenophilus sp. AP218F]
MRFALTLSLLASLSAGNMNAAGSAPTSCQRPPLPLTCQPAGGQRLQGMFFSRDGGSWQAYAFARPLQALGGRQLAILICDSANLSLDAAHWQDETNELIPNLISHVGAGAGVDILIQNSANVAVRRQLVLGERNISAAGELSEQQGDAEPALIANLIRGPIERGAHIRLRIEDSANVALALPDSHLHIGGGSLIEELINAPGDAWRTLEHGCLEVALKRSGNVGATSPRAGMLTIASGQLINEIVDYGLADSEVRIENERTGNVQARATRLFKSELIDEMIDSRSLERNRIDIQLLHSANAAGEELDIDDAELVDEAVDGGLIADSRIRLRFHESGNASMARGVRIADGELIDELIDAEDVRDSALAIQLSRSGQVASDALFIREGELIDETVDGERFTRASIHIQMEQSANADAREVSIEEGELIDEVLDGNAFLLSNLSVSLQGSGNVRARRLSIVGGELIDEIVDSERAVARSSMRVALRDSANVAAEALSIRSGELVDEIIDAESISQSAISLVIDRSANIGPPPGATLDAEIRDGELMDKCLDVETRIHALGGAVSLQGSANVDARSLRLENGRLLDEIIDSAAMSDSRVQVEVAGSGNARLAAMGPPAARPKKTEPTIRSAPFANTPRAGLSANRNSTPTGWR